MGNLPRSFDDHSHVEPGGGWISGPMSDAPEARDGRPEYSPAAVVLDVCAALRRAGIGIEPGPNIMYTASLVAADLLRSLGVRPVSAPERRS